MSPTPGFPVEISWLTHSSQHPVSRRVNRGEIVNYGKPTQHSGTSLCAVNPSALSESRDTRCSVTRPWVPCALRPPETAVGRLSGKHATRDRHGTGGSPASCSTLRTPGFVSRLSSLMRSAIPVGLYCVVGTFVSAYSSLPRARACRLGAPFCWLG